MKGGRKFTQSFRVPYGHVDRMGVMYYAHHFLYFEMARAAFMREVGLSYDEMERGGTLLPVIEAHCRYRRPARYDDEITIRSHCVSVRGPRLRIEYQVLRGAEVLAVGHTVHVCMSPAGQVLRPDEKLSALFGREEAS